MGTLPSQGSRDPKSAPGFHCGIRPMESRLHWDSFGCLDGFGSGPVVPAGCWELFPKTFPEFQRSLIELLIFGIKHHLPQPLPGASHTFPAVSSCKFPREEPACVPFLCRNSPRNSSMNSPRNSSRNSPRNSGGSFQMCRCPFQGKPGHLKDVWSWNFGIKQDKRHRGRREHPGVCRVPASRSLLS